MSLLLTISSILTVIKIVEVSFGDPDVHEFYSRLEANSNHNNLDAKIVSATPTLSKRYLSYTGSVSSPITFISSKDSEVSLSDRMSPPTSGIHSVNITTSSLPSPPSSFNLSPDSRSQTFQNHDNIKRNVYYDINPTKVLNAHTTQNNDVLRKAVILEQAMNNEMGNQAIKYNNFLKAVKRECLVD